MSRSPDCKMDILNLSRVFGPTLVGHASANPTPLIIMEDTPRQCKVRGLPEVWAVPLVLPTSPSFIPPCLGGGSAPLTAAQLLERLSGARAGEPGANAILGG